MSRRSQSDGPESRRESWEARHATAAERPPASPFIARHARRLAAIRPGQWALDVAAGSGRHTELLSALGFRVVAVDYAWNAARRIARELAPADVVVADALTLPFRGASFAVIVQTCFLERELFAPLARLLASGGTLLVETFLLEEFETRGHPRREFCLARGELAALCRAPNVALSIDEAQEGPSGPGAPFLAAVAARRP